MNNNYLKKIDKTYLWHPFTQMRDWENEDPLVIEKGEGNYLFDIDGNKYLDGISSLWVTVHGHKKKEIDDALKNQIDKISHSTLLGLSNVPAILLAEKLVKIAPIGLEKVFYSDSGSTAVEVALKMAFQYWGQGEGVRKKKFLTFENAYHGDTIGAVSLGGIDLFHQIYKPLLFDSIKAGFKNFENLIRQHADELAAVIIEPVIQGAAGMLTQPDGFLKKLRQVCSDNNVLLIFDEVATGFGRTGKMFALEFEEIVPDFLCIAKGITGGYLPLAATLTTQKIYDAFCGDYKDLKTFFHGHTYTGNPLACAAAMANIEIFEKEEVIKNLQPKIKYLTEKLNNLEKYKHVKEIRQRGFMVGIHLAKNKTEEYLLKDKVGIKVIQQCRKQGLILRPLGNVIVLMPPLSITTQEIDFLVEVTQKSIQLVCEE